MIRVLISASMMAAMVGAVEAAPKCAPGKIYRVSKKVCVDKTEAVRNGIISARQKASVARKSGTKQALLQKQANEGSRETAGITQIRRNEAAGAAPDDAGSSESRSARIILAPVKNVIGWATSPFGALVDPWTSDSLSSAPGTSFSLRMSTAD